MLRAFALVVGPFSLQDLAAGYPIFLIFKLSRLILFHICAVVQEALRNFQQLRRFIVTNKSSHYCKIALILQLPTCHISCCHKPNGNSNCREERCISQTDLLFLLNRLAICDRYLHRRVYPRKARSEIHSEILSRTYQNTEDCTYNSV